MHKQIIHISDIYRPFGTKWNRDNFLSDTEKFIKSFTSQNDLEKFRLAYRQRISFEQDFSLLESLLEGEDFHFEDNWLLSIAFQGDKDYLILVSDPVGVLPSQPKSKLGIFVRSQKKKI